MKGISATTTIPPTQNPLVAPPAIIPNVSSAAFSGASNKSAMLPCILLASMDEEVLAKAFCITLIMTSPGIMNVVNGRPAITISTRWKARENIARSMSAVIAGVATVCTHTTRNLRTSRWYSAPIPRQLTLVYCRSLGFRFISLCFFILPNIL